MPNQVLRLEVESCPLFTVARCYALTDGRFQISMRTSRLGFDGYTMCTRTSPPTDSSAVGMVERWVAVPPVQARLRVVRCPGSQSYFELHGNGGYVKDMLVVQRVCYTILYIWYLQTRRMISMRMPKGKSIITKPKMRSIPRLQ